LVPRSWECDYDSVDECQPEIVNGGGGWCAINPTWHPEPPQSENAPAADAIPAHQTEATLTSATSLGGPTRYSSRNRGLTLPQ
jgi:hypothetical protein